MTVHQKSRRIDIIEVAKLVRKDLKRVFPGQKFSVRSSKYAGGSSIHVNWVDGPTVSRVDNLIGHYKGSTFDGMQDMKSYHDEMVMTEDGPEIVHYGNDFIFTQREVSEAGRTKVIAQIAADNPWREFGPETYPNEVIAQEEDKYALVDGRLFGNAYVHQGIDVMRYYWTGMDL